MARLDVKEATLKKLFTLSGNQCAFDGCDQPIVNENGDLVGEVCHIEAANKKGERYNPAQSDDERRGFDNLLVLCPTHHTTTDNVDVYPVRRMQQMKDDHEARFAAAPFAVEDGRVEQWTRQVNEQLRARLKDIAASRLPHAAEKLIGRGRELARLTRAWSKGGTQVMAIIAWGGVGKTALAAEWIGRFAARDWEGVDAYFDWSFYSQGTREQGGASADVFIAAALEHFGDEDPQAGSPPERGDRLARLVAERKSLLVLDGLEPLQHGPGPLAGRLKDPALHALVRGLAQRPFAGLCVLTSREPVTDLDRWHGKTVDEWGLEHLSDEAGAALLHRLGANRAGEVPIGPDDRELLAASREVEGHALTLQLLGGYLKRAKRGDVRQRDSVELHEADAQFITNLEDADKPYGHAFKVMMAYERWLGDSPAGRRQLDVLRMMGLFDRAAPGHCIDALRADPAIAGLTDAVVGVGEDLWNATLDALEELGLLKRTSLARKPVRGFSEDKARKEMMAQRLDLPEELGEPEEFPGRGVGAEEVLEAHPLVREYFGRRLQQSDAEAWHEGHRRLFEELCGSVPYWPEGIDGLQPLYQAVAHGCQAGLQQECIDLYDNRILRGTGPGGFYSTMKLGAIGADLGAVACFFEDPWDRPSENLSPGHRAWLLNEAATRLRALGRLTEAVEPMRAGLGMSIGDEDWKGAAISAGNLSELEVTLGEISAAATDAGQSLTFADRSKDAFQRMGKRTTHADALQQAGRREEALRLFREAEAIQADDQPQYPRLYSVQGFRYCDLLLAEAERAAWRAWLSSVGRIPNPSGSDWQSDLRQYSAACDEVTERAEGAQRAWREIFTNDEPILDIALDHLTLGRAALYGALLSGADGLGVPPADGPGSGPATLAGEHLGAAVEGLRESGDRDILPGGLLSRAWLRFVDGDEAGCRADLEEAWEIAERGSMRLHQADVQLTRARLFRDPAALAAAGGLIEQTGYHRRDGELADAEQLLGMDG